MLQSERTKIIERFESEQQVWEDVYHRGDYDARGFQWRQDGAVFLCQKYLSAGSRILDLGCGCGHASTTLARLGYKVVGADISDAMIAQARRNAEDMNLQENCDFMVADFADSKDTLGSYDGLIALGFIEYFDDPLAVLTNVHDLLHEHGIAVVQIWNRKPLADRFLSPVYRLYRKLIHPVRSLKQIIKFILPESVAEMLGASCDPPKDGAKRTRHIRYTPAELHVLAKKAGFKVVDARGSRFFPKKFFLSDKRKVKWDEQLQRWAADNGFLKKLAVDYVAVLAKP